MSKQLGVIRLKGNIGGISFYKSGGEDLARMAGGPEKGRIENDPAFARTRENNREFGGAANTGKAFRTAFAEVTRSMGDRYLSGRLTQLFKKVCSLGGGARGRREISVTSQAALLEHLEFNRNQPLASVLNAPYTVASNAERNEVTVNLPDVAPALYVHAPSGATHFRLVLVAGALSNFGYDSATRTYLPVDAEQNALSASVQSALVSLTGTQSPYSVSLAAAFAGAPTMGADVLVLAGLGILFYQEVNGEGYLLAQGNAMKVVGVF